MTEKLAQLDLFFDSDPVVLANEIIDALFARNTTLTLQGIEKLKRTAPTSESLPAFRILAQAITDWRAPTRDVAAISEAVVWLECKITPAANKALGASAQIFMAQFFRDLANVAKDLDYDVGHPSAHEAGLRLRCGEFERTEKAALAIPFWQRNVHALYWITIARYRLHGLTAALPSLFLLAWREPLQLAPLRAELSDELLNKEWLAFEQACEWESIEEAELPAWFPAWRVLESSPTEGAYLADIDFPDCAPANAMQLLLRLIDLEKQGSWKALTSKREQLRQLNAELFALYMARRIVKHR